MAKNTAFLRLFSFRASGICNFTKIHENRSMVRYFVKLSFNGKDFVGWQFQKNGISVQEVLNKALSTIFQENVETVGCGRTDAGVHASYFVAHFDIENRFSIEMAKAIYKLNRILPRSIAVSSITAVSADAHARFDAIERTYRYIISPKKNPFLTDTAYQYSLPLDIDKMNIAAELLLSITDFTSFAKLHSDNKTNICRVVKAEWTRENDTIVFTIAADRFLRNMVRAIVGTLIDVGLGKVASESIIEIAEAGNRNFAGSSAPAEGLFLSNITYPPQVFRQK